MNTPILIRDHFENAKQYNLPRADLIICDLPYELGEKMYASNPSWYNQGDRTQGESKLAHKAAFNTDYRFSIPNFFSFATRLLRKEPGKGEKGAPCMIVFCSFQQIPTVIAEAEKAGFKHHYPLFFTKKTSAQVLKANMKIVGATEMALVLYRDKLPKFNNVDPVDGKRHFCSGKCRTAYCRELKKVGGDDHEQSILFVIILKTPNSIRFLVLI